MSISQNRTKFLMKKLCSALVIFLILGSFVIVLNISTFNYSYSYIHNSTGIVYIVHFGYSGRDFKPVEFALNQ